MEDLGLNSSSDVYQLCDLQRVIQPLSAPVASSEK